MGGLAAGGGGGMMQIEVTPEDEEAIGRLMALGFPRGAAIQVITPAPTQLSPTPALTRTLAATLTRTLSQAFMACDN